MLCLPGFGSHANTQNLPHFRAFPASIQEHSPPKCLFFMANAKLPNSSRLCPPTRCRWQKRVREAKGHGVRAQTNAWKPPSNTLRFKNTTTDEVSVVNLVSLRILCGGCAILARLPHHPFSQISPEKFPIMNQCHKNLAQPPDLGFKLGFPKTTKIHHHNPDYVPLHVVGMPSIRPNAGKLPQQMPPQKAWQSLWKAQPQLLSPKPHTPMPQTLAKSQNTKTTKAHPFEDIPTHKSSSRPFHRPRNRRTIRKKSETSANGLPPEHCGKKPPEQWELWEGKPLKPYHFNRTLGAQKASSKYCQLSSTSKQRALWEQNRLEPYPCNRPLASTEPRLIGGSQRGGFQKGGSGVCSLAPKP